MHLRSGIHRNVCVRRETEKKNREQKSGRHQPDAGLPAVAEMIKTENEIENTPAGKRPGYFDAAGYFFTVGYFLRSEGFFSGVWRIKECLFMGGLIIFLDDCSGRIIRNHGFCGEPDSNHERTKKQILMMDNMIE